MLLSLFYTITSSLLKRPITMAKKSLLFTYILWLFLGVFGIHHFYLGRDIHAFLWWSTFGGVFGLGWFRDIWRVPDYVDDANEEPSYVEHLKQKIKRGTPQFNASRFAGQLLVGYFYGFLVRIAIPEEYPLWTTGVVVPFGIAVGVYLVGNVGREKGDFITPLCVSYMSNVILACITKQEPGIMYVALFSALAFQNYREFRTQRRPKRGVCKRFFMICLGGCLVMGLWISFLYHNAAVVTEDGETIKLKVAINHFFSSPLWSDFKDIMRQLFKEARTHGWQKLFDELVRAADPTGEQNALKVLNLTENATQQEIKNRYRQLAREWHPDVYRGDKDFAQKRFIQLQEAYDILSAIKARRLSKNQKKRDDYNKFKR